MNPSADPTVTYVTQQVTATIASLSIIAGTIILAMQGFIHDGEIVTLLMGSVGAHMVIQKVAPALSSGPITTTGAVATTGDVTHIDAPPVPTVSAATPAPVVIPTTTTFP